MPDILLTEIHDLSRIMKWLVETARERIFPLPFLVDVLQKKPARQ